MKKSITQRLVDKDTWAKIWEGFNDAFTAHHKRRPRPKPEKDDIKEVFGLDDKNEEGSVEAVPFEEAESIDKKSD